ncbi:hypothetical protein [Streptomyces tropicalis]|uniref:Uncharacterized protein n=1 Tax=Streptomyces tropicalis TaxID=3034234 RepID=A0ABT6A6P4_9ACTN|nr:hypothetical protein [Streptomyces tropicalis]MDF3300309.1 hypothetical protein [Streptomyces tropicalis]
MTTPYPAQQPVSGNPYAAQGAYTPNPAAPQPQAPYAAPGPYAPQPGQVPGAAVPAGFPGHHVPGAAYGLPYGVAPAPVCRICGAGPAGDITIRQHTGLLVAMRFGRMEGPLCRGCGVALHRDMTARTLAGGWWSPVSLLLFTPLTLLWNLFVHFRLAKLPQPSPSPHGVVMDQGKPLFRRPQAYVPLVIPVWILAVYTFSK